MGETVIEDGVAVTEKETQGGDVGGVTAHIGDAVLDTVEVGQGALELAMGRTSPPTRRWRRRSCEDWRLR